MSFRPRGRHRFLLGAYLASAFLAPARAEVRVWQGELKLPTYEEGAPDPNPPFDVFATVRFNYPYTLRERITDHAVEHTWRAVFLENEYLKCTVLPDIGGHVYTCVDKISGRPMFYANPSIKKAQIGYRGAWAAFGIEFNFPVSHNWVSMSPVNYAFEKRADGTGSVTVGNVDRVYGMEWSVELRLQPGSTLLEERVTLYNRSDARHRFYWWNNAAIEVWDDSRVEYPMRFAASHGFRNIEPWPIDRDGADLSIIRNQTKGPVSLFVHGSREPFMGIWNPKTNTGTAHYADYAELPAKKIWSWGVDADGLDWRKSLSDNGSAYAEVQAGLFRNQETYAFLEPRQQIRFSEFWMPVRDTGGISRANLAGVMHLERLGGKLHAACNVNRKLAGGTLRILDGERVLAEEKRDLEPATTWSRTVEVPDAARSYTFELLDEHEVRVLAQTEGVYDWTPASEIRTGPQPSYQVPAPQERTEGDWQTLGKELELNGNPLLALQTYEQALAAFPNSFPLLKAAGRVAAASLRFAEAVKDLSAAHSRDSSDGEVSYYLGLAYHGSGERLKAQEAFEAAHRIPQFRAAGALRLAELHAQGGSFHQARQYLEQALAAAPADPRAAEELAAVLRATGEIKRARALAMEWRTRFPLSSMFREEAGEIDLAQLGADADRVIDLATEYMRVGSYEAALAVLSREYPRVAPDRSEPGALRPAEHPLVAYFRGYCKEKLGRSGREDYARASRLSTAYVFPEGAETLAVLQQASKANPEDATAHDLLGTLLFAHGLTDAGLAEWKAAQQRNPKLPVVDASMGLAELRVKRDPKRALQSFQRGITADPTNEEIYRGMDQALSLLHRPPADRVAALERYPDQANMPAPLLYELALNRAEAGDFAGAVASLRNRFFPREEGGTNVRQVWIEIQLQSILARARAGTCDAALSLERELGRAHSGFAFTADGLEGFISAPRTQYLLGVASASCGREPEARAHFERAAEAVSGPQAVWGLAAARHLGAGKLEEWRPRLERALVQLQESTESGSMTSGGLYSVGMLQKALGRTEEAEQSFQAAFREPDRMLAHHLARLARTEDSAGTSSTEPQK